RLAVAAVSPGAGWSAEQVVALAAAIEGSSAHPAAAAVRAEAERRGVGAAGEAEIHARETRPGQGVVARAGRGAERVLVAGSRALLEALGIELDPALARAGAAWGARGD